MIMNSDALFIVKMMLVLASSAHCANGEDAEISASSKCSTSSTNSVSYNGEISMFLCKICYASPEADENGNCMMVGTCGHSQCKSCIKAQQTGKHCANMDIQTKKQCSSCRRDNALLEPKVNKYFLNILKRFLVIPCTACGGLLTNVLFVCITCGDNNGYFHFNQCRHACFNKDKIDTAKLLKNAEQLKNALVCSSCFVKRSRRAHRDHTIVPFSSLKAELELDFERVQYREKYYIPFDKLYTLCEHASKSIVAYNNLRTANYLRIASMEGICAKIGNMKKSFKSIHDGIKYNLCRFESTSEGYKLQKAFIQEKRSEFQLFFKSHLQVPIELKREMDTSIENIEAHNANGIHAPLLDVLKNISEKLGNLEGDMQRCMPQNKEIHFDFTLDALPSPHQAVAVVTSKSIIRSQSDGAKAMPRSQSDYSIVSSAHPDFGIIARSQSDSTDISRKLSDSNVLRLFDPFTEAYASETPLKVLGRGFSVVRKDSMLFVIGGKHQKNFLGIVKSYDISKDSESTLPSLNYPRYRCGALFFKGKLYVAGGFNGAFMDSVEEFDFGSGWKKIVSLIHPRAGCVLAAIGGNMLVLGGLDESKYVEDIEIYNEETKKWNEYAKMKDCRANFSAITLNKRIYIFGGCNEYSSDALKTVQSFCPIEKKWENEKPMLVARMHPTLIALDKGACEYCIIALGGNRFDGRQVSEPDEKLKLEANDSQWSLIAGANDYQESVSMK